MKTGDMFICKVCGLPIRHPKKAKPGESDQRQWLDSLEPQDPSKPLGQKYGYGISQISFGPNSVYFHGGEMPGYNSFMGYDPVNDVTLVIWTNLTLSLDGKPIADYCNPSPLLSIAACIMST